MIAINDKSEQSALQTATTDDEMNPSTQSVTRNRFNMTVQFENISSCLQQKKFHGFNRPCREDDHDECFGVWSWPGSGIKIVCECNCHSFRKIVGEEYVSQQQLSQARK
jgi:hypothetical protein